MALNTRTAYVDFTTPINGVDTAIRIFETNTHCFIYVNQNPVEMHLYNENLQRLIQRKCGRIAHKQLMVICNLANHEALDGVTDHLSKILNE